MSTEPQAHKIYYENGSLRVDTNVIKKNDELIRHGKYTEYYPNGKIMFIGQFDNGQFAGEAKHFDDTGKLVIDRLFDPPGQIKAEIYYDYTIYPPTKTVSTLQSAGKVSGSASKVSGSASKVSGSDEKWIEKIYQIRDGKEVLVENCGKSEVGWNYFKKGKLLMFGVAAILCLGVGVMVIRKK